MANSWAGGGVSWEHTHTHTHTHTHYMLLTNAAVQSKTAPDLALLFLLGRQDGGSHTSNSCIWGVVWVKTLCQYGMCHNAGYIINIQILSYIFGYIIIYPDIYNYISGYIIYIWIYNIYLDI